MDFPRTYGQAITRVHVFYSTSRYREANWPPGVFAPYQIQLDDGRLIFAPHDADQVIRKLQGGDGGGEDGGAEGGGGGAQSMPPMPEHDAEDDGNMF